MPWQVEEEFQVENDRYLPFLRFGFIQGLFFGREHSTSLECVVVHIGYALTSAACNISFTSSLSQSSKGDFPSLSFTAGLAPAPNNSSTLGVSPSLADINSKRSQGWAPAAMILR